MAKLCPSTRKDARHWPIDPTYRGGNMKHVSDQVFAILLGMQRDGLIEIDEDDGTFEAVDENSKTWLHELQARFEKAGLSLSDLTMN